ncbi:hypothetical protein ACRDU6_02925 [Mycolicibacterium sp. ELW1]|uniref:hypothetical protein n=1 Tax=Mycobacteriaceae TaxID=1762 RepID=UPI00256FFA72|nr:hypothetical protein [Mycobacterium sp. ELW1]
MNSGLSGSPATLVSFPSTTVASTPQCAEQMRQIPGRVVVDLGSTLSSLITM